MLLIDDCPFNAGHVQVRFLDLLDAVEEEDQVAISKSVDPGIICCVHN